MNKPAYVVGGFPRSGTTMMMKALEAGGIAPACPELLTRNYEIRGHKYRRSDCCEAYGGMAFKAVWQEAVNLWPGDYKVVVVTRGPWDVHLSIANANDGLVTVTPEQYGEWIIGIIRGLKKRNDMQVSVTRYEDVLDDPVAEFQKLVDVGWPIDSVKAASVVDLSKCHYRVPV